MTDQEKISSMIVMFGPAPWAYFAYGMNMSQSGMAQRCPTARFVGNRRATGYHRVERGVYDLKPDMKTNTLGAWGALFMLQESDLAPLDSLESFPSGYTRIPIVVIDKVGTRSIAMTYTMTEERNYGGDRLSRGYAVTCYRAAVNNETPLCPSLERIGRDSSRNEYWMGE